MFSNPVILWKGKIECYKANVTIGLGPWPEKKKKTQFHKRQCISTTSEIE